VLASTRTQLQQELGHTHPPPVTQCFTTSLQGGVSHMVRFAGNLHARRYRFWLEVPAGTALEARVYVKHVEDSPATAALLAELPDWVSPAAVTSYHSRYLFR
jgi:hypothetical protein